MWCSSDGTTWTEVDGNGFGDANNSAIYPDAVFDGRLYAGTSNFAAGAQVWRTAQQAQAELDINYGTGSPGSFFTLTGQNFPPDSAATIAVNGHVLGTVSTDSAGNLAFLLDTGGAGEGSYHAVATVNPSATASFLLDATESLRPQEGTGPVFEVPSGIAYTSVVYLPLILR